MFDRKWKLIILERGGGGDRDLSKVFSGSICYDNWCQRIKMR